MKWKHHLPEVSSAVVLFLFVYTAMSKLADHARFSDVLHSSPIVSRYADFIAWAVPVAELIVALFLLMPFTRLKGLYASLVLLILFTMYILWMILFADHLPCNCGGVISQLSWNEHVLFNVFFIVVSGIGIYSLKKK